LDGLIAVRAGGNRNSPNGTQRDCSPATASATALKKPIHTLNARGNRDFWTTGFDLFL
jgi:hypothetical protein